MRHHKLTARREGLTLIEVMVALGVLVILVSGIFFVVQTALKTVIQIDNHASREDEITNLVDILRGGFRNLPSQARLVAQPFSDNGTPTYLFIVRNAPNFLSWRSQPESKDTIVLLSARQDGDGASWRVCLKRFAPPENFSEKDFNAKNILHIGRKVPWLELVGSFNTVAVRFFDARTKVWKDKWDDVRARPTLIELTLTSELVKDTRSATAIMWIPPVKEEVAS